ncbi:hypothetical protein VP01_3261g3 [Puccinia sorghi]|uniref:Uncharacterized protein n=1 Tax=Puccinia sorghi TaxID=27349 RepID=A0A0L6UXV8_9BASI|nr:hypothetical protein VP01_3261g3 [Puccinia sorghi]
MNRQNWIHSSFQRMNQEFQTGVSRSEAVNRLRHRMNHPRSSSPSVDQPPSSSPPPSTDQHNPPNAHLLGILRQVRTQTTHHYHDSKFIGPQTYLLYCGHHPSSTQHSQGCGKLISVRAASILPKSFRSSALEHPILHNNNHIKSSRPKFNLLTSDTLPFPNSADTVDPLTQQSFENDPSNPFHPTNPLRLNCTCEKTYLGCLSCGNILGHSVISACNVCRELAVFHPHFYYLNRLTALPRYNDAPISLDFYGYPIPDRPEENLMNWAEAARQWKKDVDSGYVQSPVQEEPVICAPHLAPLASSPSLSSRVRNAILMGSLVDDEGSSWWNDRSWRESIQPFSHISEPSSTLSDDHSPLRRASLSRRPAVRLPSHLSLDRRSIHPRASSNSTSESWVIREGRTGEDGFPRELLRLRRESDMSSAGQSVCPTGLTGQSSCSLLVTPDVHGPSLKTTLAEKYSGPVQGQTAPFG